jgi:succinyl-diaminopimelate desuccinylase
MTVTHQKALTLAQDLIRCPSITPKDAGVFDVLETALDDLGFTCHRLVFEKEGLEPVSNLFASFGNGAPHFCFAGHLDVVPTGDEAAWQHPPFAATVEDGILYGRGTSDMKGAVAGFIAAAEDFINKHQDFNGTISLLIAGDEEDPKIAGTRHVLEWLQDKNLIPDMCLVGEPTNPAELGEMIKIGRRGSVTGHLKVSGMQGHAAYPHLADNPLPKMVALLSAVDQIVFDQGSDFFQPTNLEIVSIDTGNTADNVIPVSCTAMFNTRFNDLHSSDTVIKQIEAALNSTGYSYEINYHISGESFLTTPGALSDTLASAVQEVTGRTPDLTTTGGTSDARFISQYCPVVEFGGVGASMHKIDEHIELATLNQLTDIYSLVLTRIFNP